MSEATETKFFLQDLKDKILNRQLSKAEVSTQYGVLQEQIAAKQSAINVLEQEYNETFDVTKVVAITTAQDELKTLQDKANAMNKVLAYQGWKAKTDNNIYSDLDDKLEELDLDTKILAIKTAVQSLTESIDDYLSAKSELIGIVDQIVSIADDVNVDDLKDVEKWFGKKGQEYNFTTQDFKECKHVKDDIQRVYDNSFSVNNRINYLTMAIYRIEKERK